MAKVSKLEISTPQFDIPKNTLVFHFTSDDGPIEVCRFWLTETGRLDIQISSGIEMSDAARRFIEVVKDQLENIAAMDLLDTEVQGQA